MSQDLENIPDVSLAIAPEVSRGRFRWVICGLLFFAATVNYVDRQVIGLLKPMLQAELHWNEIDYSNIIFAFQVAYALGQMIMGRVMDWLGTRKGFSLSVFVWSLAAMAHALVHSVLGFSAARFVLGLGESGNFPASIKTVAEWFQKKERALATGIFNSGTNVGAIVTPLIIPWLTFRFGWQGAFVATGALGLIWLGAWLLVYQSPRTEPRLSEAERANIQSDPVEQGTQVSWRSLLRYRETWAFAIAKFLTDPIWWLYLFWLPDFLYRYHHLNLKGMMLPLLVVYNSATLGSVGGGWFSSALIRRGWSVSRSRKTAMLVCAICVVPIVFASRVSGLWSAVLLVSLAAAAHQGWSANLYTTASDMFPRSAVGSIVGFGGMAGAVGGMLVAKSVGYVLQWRGSYGMVFGVAGFMYLIAWGILRGMGRSGEIAVV